MQRSHMVRAILIFALVITAVVYLFPTLHAYRLNRQLNARLAEISAASGVPLNVLRDEIFRFDVDIADRIRQAENVDDSTKAALIERIENLRSEFYDKLVKAQSGEIKLGLDLQGGMYLVLEVNLVDLMDRLAKNRDATFNEISREVHAELEKDPTADFQQVVLEAFSKRQVPMARYFGDPRQSDREIVRMLRKQAEDAVDLTLTKLRNRIDEFGVSEPSITKQGNRRIVIELPGVQDPRRARNLIGRTALLEFKLVADPEITAQVIKDVDAYLAAEQKAGQGEEAAAAVEAAQDTATAEEDTTGAALRSLLGGEEELPGEAPEDTSLRALQREHPFASRLNLYQRQIMVLDKDRPMVERFLSRQDVQNIIPPEYEFLWSNKPSDSGNGQSFWYLYLVRKRAELTGAALKDAQVTIGTGYSDPSQAGAPIVNLTMKREGARRFARVTENNVGEYLAIVLDGKVHMAPVIRVKIPDGRAIIEGSESMEEASDLAVVLRAGALPAPVEIIEERTVGPSLGSDSVHAGTFSALLGFAGVILFMLFYYRGAGFVADIVLMLNILFVMAVLAGFGFTLTLPGIAGIILTIGMAVDANVLIYERIREELNAGKTVWNAIKNGYGRAFVTIMDANITTLIAGIVLYQFGTGPIRGFALTLMIGIISSMFTALVVSRAIFDWITTRWSVKKLSI